MAHRIEEALVLRATDFGESDRIVHLLTPESGRIDAIAKGAKRSVRRFPGTLDLFNRLRVELGARRPTAMARLDHAVLVGSFPRLRTEPSRFALGCYLLELLDRLAPEGGARSDTQRLFAFAVEALGAVEAGVPDERLRTLLEIRALDALGLRPELRCCVRCGDDLRSQEEVGFHVAEGGPVCGACGVRVEGLLTVHLGTLRALDRGLQLAVGALNRLALGPGALAEARRLISRFQRFHLGVELRSERFLDEILDGSEAERG